jgi:hypothetical protein
LGGTGSLRTKVIFSDNPSIIPSTPPTNLPPIVSRRDYRQPPLIPFRARTHRSREPQRRDNSVAAQDRGDLGMGVGWRRHFFVAKDAEGDTSCRGRETSVDPGDAVRTCQRGEHPRGQGEQKGGRDCVCREFVNSRIGNPKMYRGGELC